MADTNKGSSNRMSSLKDVLFRLASEDPMMAGIFIICVIPLASRMFTAVASQNTKQIEIIIFTLSLIIIFVYIPLIMTKTARAFALKSKAGKEALREQQKEIFIERERNKQKRLNELFEAKINNIQAQTDYILERTATFEMDQLIGIAKELQDGWDGSLSDLQEEQKTKIQRKVQSVINTLREKNKDHDALYNMLTNLESTIEEDEEQPTVLDTDKPLFEDPKLDLDFKLQNLTPQAWTCSKCNHINPKKAVKCKKCHKGKS